MSTTAFTARVTMHSAAWGDETGSVVTFKLPMSSGAQDQRNPFHGFTKRRKGKAGTRFMMACHRTIGEDGETRQLIYEDEVMLAGWNDSQQNGHTVKFWVCNDIMGHPFDGISRKEILLLGLAELDDDNEVIDQQMRDRIESQGKAPTSRMSYVAAMLCKSVDFWSWCQESDYTLAGNPIIDEESAKLWLYLILNIDSRAELDISETKAAQFDKIRKDYLVWLGQAKDGDPF